MICDHEFTLRAFIFRERSDVFLVQAVEHDLAAQGRDVDEAQSRFISTLVGQVLFDLQDGTQPVKNLPAPPADIWRRAPRFVTTTKETLVVVSPRGSVQIEVIFMEAA